MPSIRIPLDMEQAGCHFQTYDNQLIVKAFLAGDWGLLSRSQARTYADECKNAVLPGIAHSSTRFPLFFAHPSFTT